MLGDVSDIVRSLVGGTTHEKTKEQFVEIHAACECRKADAGRIEANRSAHAVDNPREGNPKPGEQDKLLTPLSGMPRLPLHAYEEVVRLQDREG